MLSRHDLSDPDWDRIEPLIPGRAGGHGVGGADNRLFVNAVRYLAKTGIAWADLPACYGKPNSVWQRHNRWCRDGVWGKVAAAPRDDDTEWVSVDSSCVRATGAAARAKKNGTAAAAKPRRRWAAAAGGFGTKIRAVVTPLGHPLVIELTGSEAADSPRLPGLIAGLAADAVLADEGYDSAANRAAVRSRGAEPCIPPRRNRAGPTDYDRHPYKERNVAERCFARVKQYRRVATRYDKKAANFLGFVWVASIAIMLA